MFISMTPHSILTKSKDSLIALNYWRGVLKWHAQHLDHDYSGRGGGAVDAPQAESLMFESQPQQGR